MRIMKNVLIVSLFSFFWLGFASAQYSVLRPGDPEFGEMVAVINEWCDAHFTNCFGWRFVNLNDQSLSISRIRYGKWKMEGRNTNQGVASGGRGSETYERKFVATVEKLDNNTYSVYMKKQSITILGESWLECTKTIRL